MKSKTRLTIRKIETLKAGKELWDTDVPGLHVRSLKTGKFFYLFYRNQYGQQRKPSIGRYGALTLDGARTKAHVLLADIAQGHDPSISKQQDRVIKNPTIQDLKTRWETDYARDLKSKENMIRQWEKHVLPVIGSLKVRDITKSDVGCILNTIESNYTHNRVRSLISKAFNLSEEWGWRDDFTNPVRKIKRRPEKNRRRYLKPDEMARLGKALRCWEAKGGNKERFSWLIKLLIYTGARRGEILSAQWDYVDWYRGVLDLPVSKTGAKEIILPESAICLLKQIEKQKTSPWIITNKSGRNPIKYPYPNWTYLCNEAEINNLRIHDLRHSFASTALSSADGTLQQVGELLGHADPGTTARYAHFMATPKRVLANKTAGILDEWLNSGNARNN